MNDTIQDLWAQRTLEPRYKDDPELRKEIEANFIHMRNTVLHNAHIVAGETVLDVGEGADSLPSRLFLLSESKEK